MRKNFIQKNNQNKAGFTLIEMLLSIALFSIVLTISLGTIFTVIDANRKTQTLTLTMNNLNFAIESMTRDLKTAEPSSLLSSDNNQIKLIDQDGNHIIYKYDNVDQTIEKSINDGGPFLESDEYFSPIVSEDVVIDYVFFDVLDAGTSDQPRSVIYISGYAEITERIRSDFELQTTVTSRKLDI